MPATAVWEHIEQRKVARRAPDPELLQGERPDPAEPAGTDRLPQIRHIVVLMMENHSFDNYLGTLGRGDGFPLGPDGQPDAANPDASGLLVDAYPMKSTKQHEGAPCQSWRAAHAQWSGGSMNGFVQ